MRRVLLTALLTGITCSAPAARQAARDAGAIALLGESGAHTADDELRGALLDRDPQIRLVAARVAGTGDHRELLGDAIGALLREQDPVTGAELVRDALYLGAERDLPLIDREVKRLGRMAAVARTEWLARTNPDQFQARLSALAEEVGPGPMASLVSMASAQHPARQSELLNAWMREAPPSGWRELLESAYGWPTRVDRGTAIIRKGLASDRPEVREETVWFLVAALGGDRSVPRDLMDAALAATIPDASEWERFGRELLARRRTKARTPDRSSLLTGVARGSRDLAALASFEDLLDTERAAVAKAVRDNGKSREPSWVTIQPASRTVSLTGGVVPAAVAAAGCKVIGEMGQADVSYWPDGRPQRIQVDRANLPPPCVKVLTALARLSIAEPYYPVGSASQKIVVPFHHVLMQCRGTSSRPLGGVEYADPAALTPARLVREVKPNYNREAMQGRVEGVATLAATVSERGCVEEAHMLTSLPPLDVQALWAVTQWIFEPARYQGKPVPMRVSIELTFKLK
jgi:TonB family protein